MELLKNWQIIEAKNDVIGINRSSELINWASEFLAQIKKALADGKIQWYESLSLGAKAIGGINELKNIAEISKELQNINVQEAAALAELLQSKFGFSSAQLPELISWLGSLVDFATQSYKLIK
jgi:hypothetical protein